ncbi:MAG: PQQ-dependent methanol/ethanol family dehydrogenase [Hydrogenophaga sp.]|jgi:alcohol dehydrogenase (cytochrome c)|uniref:PQQ-dependent methanol/ethanol family dehydrogenase n=1 Tax=Hydrogenophaga sp. TaxID=1904254 RepID=UPI002726B42E|nr:PQQ-dependent methanol/ethanol family dehydrogenase [Hydrogenophaga sp.]MDO9484287.1 PQQ-dependent methanol/ethanol family dehydrogenase [Hydrogenophaga sp.]MDO9571327.1 PQQ-dependent methanol/ethanol family dehydrogenase [Hydrogenophaga sp.]MDP2093523.1 PQQ-dependent methanol/ethanol family dehydrogenase [Hydrogenophaga sp.]MDP2222030.1 PQQ-dependent methanol/ethanol family dehydrogenase [Hydrogenophaga sp.]MDP3343647.1 PQQ-dependent methanol/ethanol family dehydrogenase [Hydrogenophaga sp
MAATAHVGAQVTDAMIANDAATPDNVLSWGLGTQGQRHSSLTGINAKNINRLVPAWSMSFGGEKQRGQQSQPLVHNGKMFVTASYSRIYAVDTKTGQKLWKYEHRLPEGIMPCCDVINRGAALYDNLVIFGTLDAQLVALDQNTGKVVWREKIDDYSAGYSYTAAPLIAEGLLITGLSGGEFGVVGRVEARDPKTGKMVWVRPVVEGHMGYKDGQENGITGTTNASWPGETWKTGGAAPWLGGSYDPKTGLAYFGTGNPGPWNSHVRKGDNLYSASTVAIDVKTGKIVWHYQSTPNDGWDYDGVNEFVTFDMDGQRVGAKADRNGFFYVNDAATGKLINAFPFVKKVTWATGIDLKTGRPNFDPANRPGDPTAAGGDGSKGKAVFSAPGFLGGKNQMPMAYSPKTGFFYVPTNEWGMEIWNEPITYKKGAAYLGAGFTIKPLFDDHIGSLRAINPKTGKVEWEVKNNAPLWGGVLTAGDLVFWGTPEGYLKAADAKTGKVVWQFQTGSGVVAPPITWTEGGEQYVSVVSGWGGAVPLWGGEVAKKVNFLEQGGSVWTFKLLK